jgi:hypothetical protein
VKGLRVYYIPLLVFSALLGAGAAAGPVELTVTPAMTKGPVGAPVVIVVFTDYQ